MLLAFKPIHQNSVMKIVGAPYKKVQLVSIDFLLQ